jgi:hypothetical protein
LNGEDWVAIPVIRVVSDDNAASRPARRGVLKEDGVGYAVGRDEGAISEYPEFRNLGEDGG